MALEGMVAEEASERVRASKGMPMGFRAAAACARRIKCTADRKDPAHEDDE